MALSLPIVSSDLLRKATFEWRHGALPARAALFGVAAVTIVLLAASWQALRGAKQADRLSARVAALQTAQALRGAASQVGKPTDAVQSLSAAPEVAQIVETLQRVADQEGARIVSLQAEDHAPTAVALGHLDLMLSIRAPYPSILTVIQQVLDRYPGATLRQILVVPVSAVAATPLATAVPIASAGAAAQPMTPSEAHVTLAFWRRPLGVDHLAPTAAVESAASAAASSGAKDAAATVLVPRLGAKGEAAVPKLSVVAGALPPKSGASSMPMN